MNKYNQIKGAIYGLLIGDAVGVPYELNNIISHNQLT